MCGIVGYIGKGLSKKPVLEGLARLEYRGYDAGGFGCYSFKESKLSLVKAVGGIDSLRSASETVECDGHLGIGHMRWSTHGSAVELRNAHPHQDCQDSIFIVHNGIVENYHQLKQELSKNHIFVSDTDTECIAHLLETTIQHYSSDFRKIFVSLLSDLKGAYAIAALIAKVPDTLFVVRHKSPLCIGRGLHEMYIASDPLAFGDEVSEVFFMPDNSFAFVKKDSIELYDHQGAELSVQFQPKTFIQHTFEKGPYKHFMLKEIYEQRQVISKTLQQWSDKESLWENLKISPDTLKNVERLHLIACGTSWHAARISAYFFEHRARIPVQVYLASEFRYAPFFPDSSGIYVAISQSGETADTLEALRMVREKSPQSHTIAVTNIASSSMARECHGLLWTQAGPEIAVASTKAFTAQLASLYLWAHVIAIVKNCSNEATFSFARTSLEQASEILEQSIERYKDYIIHKFAPRYAHSPYFIFLGRQAEYSLALEAALKLKEIAYIFSEAYPAGELKHGPLALIAPDIPVVLFSSLDDLIYKKILSNAEEIKSRKGHLIVYCFEGQEELVHLADVVFIIPRVDPLLASLACTGLMQYMVYEIASFLNRPIDKPRNLAKSVTVE